MQKKGLVIKSQLKAIKYDGKNITSVKKSLLTRDKSTNRVSKNFHALDH